MIQTTVDVILESVRSIGLSPDEQAELIQRLRDGEGEEHKPAGQWVGSGHPLPAPVGSAFNAEEAGFHIDWVHGPKVDPDHGLAITFYHGRDDGKPVIQIDGNADFRINVNDCPIWDQQTGEPYVMPEELESDMVAKPQERQVVWVGMISDIHGNWIYVGTSEEALYRVMRSNYGQIEYRDESNFDWKKRVMNIAEIEIDSFYVEEE